MTHIQIPKSEQLAALAQGLPAFYRLIERYTHHSVSSDFRRYASVTKEELEEYLSRFPGLAEQHVISEREALHLHDVPALMTNGKRWMVCWLDHGKKVEETLFDDINRAAAHFIMIYW